MTPEDSPIIAALSDSKYRVSTKDSSGRYVYANNAQIQALGLSTINQVLGHTDEAFFSPEDATNLNEQEKNILLTGNPYEGFEELELLCGQRYQVFTSKHAIVDSAGKNIGLLSISVEATIKQKTKNRHEIAIESSGLGAWHRDLSANGRLWVSSGWCSVLGFNKKKWAHCPKSFNEFIALVHRDDRDRVRNAVKKHLEGQSPRYRCEYRLKNYDGDWRWLRSTGKCKFNEGHPTDFSGVHEDITQEHDERTFRVIAKIALDSMRSYVFVKNSKLKFIYVNRALREQFDQDVIGLSDRDVNPNSSEVEHFEWWDRLVLKKRVVSMGFTITPKADGVLETFHGRLLITLKERIHIPNIGNCVLGVSRDITPLLKELLDPAEDAIYIKSYTKHFMFANKAMSTITGIPTDEMVGKTHAELFSFDPMHAEQASADEEKILREKKAVESHRLAMRHDGTTFHSYTKKFPLLHARTNEVRAIVAVSRDITEVVKLEKSITENELYAAIGHCFGNNLALLHSEWSNAQRKMDLQLSCLQESVDMARNAALLERETGTNFEKIDVRLLFEKIKEVNNDIRLKFESLEVGVEIMGIEFHLYHSILELINNALRERSRVVNVGFYSTQDYISIFVNDDGPGIPHEIRKSMFDPGSGRNRLGLGLGYVNRVAKLHHGKLRLNNKSPEGTNWEIKIPRHR